MINWHKIDGNTPKEEPLLLAQPYYAPSDGRILGFTYHYDTYPSPAMIHASHWARINPPFCID